MVADLTEAENRLGGNVDDLSFDEEKVWISLRLWVQYFWVILVFYTHAFFIEMQVEELKELSKKPDIYDRLTRSLAPNIWELDDVKKGLLCQVFPHFFNSTFSCLFLSVIFHCAALWWECFEIGIRCKLSWRY